MADKLQVLVNHFKNEFIDGSDDSKADFIADVEGWARVHGLVMGNGQPTPVTLVAHPIKKTIFNQALNSSILFNRLVHRISQNPDFIRESLKHVQDPFTVKLVSIMDTVLKEGVRQEIAMGIHRSDYMIHKGSKLQQVEINTISSAFGALSHQMSLFHTHLIHQWGNTKSGHFDGNLDLELTSRAAVPNQSLHEIVQLFASAGYAYSQSRSQKVANPANSSVYNPSNLAVLMIVQPGERNSTDQRWIQYALEEKYQIKTIRHSLKHVKEHATLNEESGVLTLNGYEIAVAYYRAGYTPTDYPTQDEWDARLLIERSVAIKCPNIFYHLVGTKKIQQVLAGPGVVERFMDSDEESKAVRDCFAGLFSLDKESDQTKHAELQKIIKHAIENPHAYVMKPQREGGGNLLANEEMVEALKRMSDEERSDYILMERIEPEAHPTILFRDSKMEVVPCIAELGVYCLMLAGNSSEIVNKNGGWLLRSKPENVEDGGVAAGRAFLDSPYLY